MGGVLAKTVAHFWPDLRGWLDGLRDPRDPNRTVYPARCLVWTGLLVFLLKPGSRRQIRFEPDSPTAVENLNRLAGCRQDRVPHGDTLNYFLGRLAPGELEGLRLDRVRRLLRMKVLEGARLFGHFPVGVDGTGQLYFRRRRVPARTRPFAPSPCGPPPPRAPLRHARAPTPPRAHPAAPCREVLHR